MNKIQKLTKKYFDYKKENTLEVALALTFRDIRKSLFKQNHSPNNPDANLINFLDPWDKETFEERKEKLIQKSNKKKIIYLYEATDYGTFRYRAYNQIQILNNTNTFLGIHFWEKEIPFIQKHIKNASIIVFVRLRWSFEVDIFLTEVKKHKIKLVYDIDDLMFKTDYLKLYIKQLDLKPTAEVVNYYNNFTSLVYLLMKEVDVITTTNKFLAQKIQESFNKPIKIIPNFINKEQFEESNKIINFKQKVNKSKNSFIIGYFSGTRTHNRDFKMIEEDLIKILNEFSFVKLLLVGHLDLSGKFDKYNNRIIKKGLHNYIDLQKEISKCDLNLIPLHINDFTNSKSEIKFFEAGIVKVPSIMSSTYVYKNISKQNNNGILANNKKDQWYKEIKKMIQNKESRYKLAKNAFDYSQKNYFGKVINKNILDVYQSVIKL